MTQEKWVVEIEENKYHVWATDTEDAFKQAIKLAVIRVYRHENTVHNEEPVTKIPGTCIDQEVIDALTPQELCRAIDRINEELNNRNVGTVTIPNYANLMKED